MKTRHLIPLLIHVLLLAAAAWTINDYPGLFLAIAAAALVGLAIYAVLGRESIWRGHLLGTALEFAVFFLGIIDVNAGAFGLGGGPFALLFYTIALAGSCVLLPLIALARRMLRRRELL